MKTIIVRGMDRKILPDPIPVQALSIDRTLALHRTVGEKGWTITHVRTGLGILTTIRRRKDAEMALELIAHRYGNTLRRIRMAQDVTAFVRDFRDSLGPLARTIPMHHLPSYWR